MVSTLRQLTGTVGTSEVPRGSTVLLRCLYNTLLLTKTKCGLSLICNLAAVLMHH